MSDAYVTKIGDDVVLIDPAACEVARAVAKHNCKATLNMHAERVKYFAQRIKERGDDPKDVVIVVVNYDGASRDVADAMMPWFADNVKRIRDSGQTPFARGLAGRAGIQEYLNAFDKECGNRLCFITGVAVVVMDHGVAEVFEVAE